MRSPYLDRTYGIMRWLSARAAPELMPTTYTKVATAEKQVLKLRKKLGHLRFELVEIEIIST